MKTSRLRQILAEDEYYPDQRAELDALVQENNPNGWTVGFMLDGQLIVHNVDYDCLLPFERIYAQLAMSKNRYDLFVKEASAKSHNVYASLKVYSSSDLSDHETFLACLLPNGRYLLANNGEYFDVCPIIPLED